MLELTIDGENYTIYPRACSSDDIVFPFYINITNSCNAKCDFCLNTCNNDLGKLDYNKLESVLDQTKNYISRFSISGGEPLINIDELEKLLQLVQKYNKNTIVNTNGSFLLKNVYILNKYNIDSIQLSRHHYDDDKNNEIFKINTISFEDLKNLKLKADLRINCLLIKNYIDSKEEIVKFLEKISQTDISQVGFISMTKLNKYTNDNFVDYRDIIKDLDSNFLETLKMSDGDECSCTNNLYVAKNGKTIFVYFRYKEDNCAVGKSLFFDSTGLKQGY